MNGSGRGLATAERRLEQGQARIARQAAVVEGFELAGDARAVEHARETLAILQVGLALAHLWLMVESASSEDEPDSQAE